MKYARAKLMLHESHRYNKKFSIILYPILAKQLLEAVLFISLTSSECIPLPFSDLDHWLKCTNFGDRGLI